MSNRELAGYHKLAIYRTHMKKILAGLHSERLNRRGQTLVPSIASEFCAFDSVGLHTHSGVKHSMRGQSFFTALKRLQEGLKSKICSHDRCCIVATKKEIAAHAVLNIVQNACALLGTIGESFASTNAVRNCRIPKPHLVSVMPQL